MENRLKTFPAIFIFPSLLGVLLPIAAAPAMAQQDQSCVITLSLIDEVALSNLEFQLDYSDAGGQIEGSGRTAVCRHALGGALAAFNDEDANQRIRVGILRLKQFSGPAVLVGCRFSYDTSVPVAADFHVSVQVAARNGEDANVNPLPKVQVTDIECPGQLPSPTTTTTTVTTSTAPVTSTTLVVDGRCGFPVTDGEQPMASDALYTLRAAVGLAPCAKCVCDVDGSAKVAASDALAILRAAVGVGTPFACPDCS
ncbi:MAG: hypothetical protein HY899_12370 [Deltaproteobacteria bacterium]|nr:hypothetical protein [Deltaproteobacteria bacterium]